MKAKVTISLDEYSKLTGKNFGDGDISLSLTDYTYLLDEYEAKLAKEKEDNIPYEILDDIEKEANRSNGNIQIFKRRLDGTPIKYLIEMCSILKNSLSGEDYINKASITECVFISQLIDELERRILNDRLSKSNQK